MRRFPSPTGTGGAIANFESDTQRPMTSFRDHFSEVASAYSAFRPGYPTAMVRYLAAAAPGRGLAWDAATGNGQAAVLLADLFERVRATDASAEQIARARPHPGIDYAVGQEDASGLPDHEVDLVTVAQALHWFHLPRFYREVDRVLKPGGILAAWSYGRLTISPEIDRVVEEFYSNRIGCYWPPERRHVETGYRELPFPYAGRPAPEWAIEAELDRAGLLNYIGTWSAVQEGRRREPTDPLRDLEGPLAEVWSDADERRAVRWPLALRWGYKPEAG